MPRLPLPALALALALALAGCGPTAEDLLAKTPAPPPQDSGEGQPAEVAPDRREEGNGFPDRLHAGLARAVRGPVEVRVESAAAGGRLVVAVSVRTRGGPPVPFAGWADPAGVTLRGPDGREYALAPWTADELAEERGWEAAHPEHHLGLGAGEVTPARPRLATLRFDGVPEGAEHLDLDLSGAAAGLADPIRFRIPRRMITPPGVFAPPGKDAAP